MTDLLVELLGQYGYVILFIWSILEGEIGLVMGGILSHTGHMSYPLAIFFAGLGGFSGDQIYFYIGRYNKKYIYKKLRKQRRKFAIAHILLKKYGWPIIFIQRYLYGFRTVIPMSIGLTGYSSKKFALINLLSAWVWAAIIITPAYLLGDKILIVLEHAKKHWYVAIPITIVFALVIWYTFHTIEKNIIKKRNNESRRNISPLE